MAQYDYAIFIGRCQPPHIHHIQEILKGLDLANKVLIVLGSARTAPNIKNPWSAEQRQELILSCFPKDEQHRLEFFAVRDYIYDDYAWMMDLYNQVYSFMDEEQQKDPNSLKVCLLGSKKDTSSWYLDILDSRWTRELSKPPAQPLISSTKIRELYFSGQNYEALVLPPVFVQMEIAKSTEWYKSIAEEQQFVEGYKALWAGTPFPVTFNTTDTVVIKSGHLLVVKRKFNPGKGQLALPGGFLESKMTIIDSALKELKEETGIKVNKTILRNSIVDQKTFDAVNRSTRGRTITHGVCINLGATGELPHVKGSDDAERAMWIPVYDIFVREPEFYEDHAHIANFFISRLNK